jgi:hypothetical protein
MKAFGIDISEFQKGIDLAKAKKEGVTFVMIRAGFTGSANGISKKVDSAYQTHYKNAKKQGLNVGAYWFSRATSYEKGKSEAEYMYNNCLKGKSFEYPIAIDVEDSVYQAKSTKKDITEAIKGFCEYLEKKGYWVTIYANSNWFKNKMNLSELKRYDKWLANWCKTNPKTPEHDIWQFGGSTNEIRSNKIAGMIVDQDYSYKDYPKLIKAKGLNGLKKETEKEKKQYTNGEYITLTELNVRTGPGTNYRQKKVKELTKDGQKNATSKNKNAYAVYKKGTEFTAIKIINNKDSTWAKTPSGYVCIKLKKEIYCKKI